LEIKNIAVVGAGNIGLALANEIYQNTKIKVRLITARPNKIQTCFSALDTNSGKLMSSEVDFITNDYAKGLSDVALVFITVPSFLIESVINKLVLKKPAVICFVPGLGGKEFYVNNLLQAGNTICGFDRTPFVSRISDSEVRYSKKSNTRIAVLKNTDRVHEISAYMSRLLQMPCEALKNYLTVTFTPSNPILHTARLYTMFKEALLDTKIDGQIYFYKEWTDVASDILLKMDKELQSICSWFTENGIDLSGVISLKEHYEAYSVESMTAKIKSIASLSAITSPLVHRNECYFLDADSRYFTEDFPFGLCVIKAFSRICGIETFTIDQVLKWYENLFKKEYYIDNQFCGKDLCHTSIPQNFGINTLSDVMKYYC